MHEPGVLNSGDTIAYAFGISHGEHRGLATVGHTGSWVGYRAAMSRYPEAGHSFVAFCNRSAIAPATLIASTAEVYLEDRMEPVEAAEAEVTAEEEAPAEATGDADSPDEPDLDIPNRTRYAGSFYSPELDTAYRIVEEGDDGLTLHVGRLDPAALMAESEGVLTSERGWTLRFLQLVDNGYQAMMVDAGRVQNLRFARVEG